jgi:hypothetical protein
VIDDELQWTGLAGVEDVDMAEAIMSLQVEEIAYRAMLQTMTRTLPPSLVSFLATTPPPRPVHPTGSPEEAGD